MKISQEHYNSMRDKIAAFGIDKIQEHKAYLQSPANPRKPKDLNMRLRWDCCWSAIGARWLCDNLPDCNDEHIDTVLRKIMKELGIN